MTAAPEETWYIVKQTSGQCKILSAAELDALTGQAEPQAASVSAEQGEKWGPFKAQNQAIAKRVGLIRAGKCQPVS